MTTRRRTAGRRGAASAWLGVAAVIGAVLWIAVQLDPDARGFGTHTQLGLPPCGFRALTGLPCPGCGLTTSFAHGVRGEWVDAAVANPFGLALFLSCVAFLPVSLFAWVRGWSLDDALDRVALDRWVMLLAASGIVVWIARVIAAA